MKSALCRIATAGVLVMLAVVAGCRSTAKPADPIAELQGKVGKEVRAVVKNPETAAQVEALAQQTLDVFRQMLREGKSYQEQFNVLNARYDATQQQFADLAAAHKTKHDALLKQSLEFRGRIAALLSDDEWSQLKALRADLRSLGIQIN